MTTVHTCSNPATWHPTMHTHQDHHHPPTAWRKLILNANPNADQSWWRLIPVCGLCHDEYHALLDLHVRYSRRTTSPFLPPGTLTRSYSLFIRRLVAEAWKFRPERPVYTIRAA